MSTVRVNIRAPLASILAARLQGLSKTGVERALRSAVTFTAKDYVSDKYKSIDQDIDRPKQFTRRAYSWDGANRSSSRIEARAFVRDKQSKYLEWTEYGGVKRRGGGRGNPISIKPEFQDRYGGGWGQGGLRRKFLAPSEAKMAGGKGRKNNGTWKTGTVLFDAFSIRTGGEDVYGIWKKTKLAKGRTRDSKGRFRTVGTYWKLQLAVKFVDQGDYDAPKLNFRKDAKTFGNANMPRTVKRLLDREIRNLRQR